MKNGQCGDHSVEVTRVRQERVKKRYKVSYSHANHYRSPILFVSESWGDCGCLVHDLEVSDERILRSRAKVNRRKQ